MTKNINPPEPGFEPGKMALAISATMEVFPVALGVGFIRAARYAVPKIMVTATTPRIVSVCDALRPCGRRNALTPFDMASVPVSADDPEEKECRITNNPAEDAVPIAIGSGGGAAAGQFVTHFATPTTIRASMERMNP
jgi:hypothetical protein